MSHDFNSAPFDLLVLAVHSVTGRRAVQQLRVGGRGRPPPENGENQRAEPRVQVGITRGKFS